MPDALILYLFTYNHGTFLFYFQGKFTISQFHGVLNEYSFVTSRFSQYHCLFKIYVAICEYAIIPFIKLLQTYQ